MKRFVLWVCAIASVVVPCTAWSARPFVTDDARLTTAGSCQLESWTRRYVDSTEQWALPACNPTGNLELTVGRGWARTTGQAFTHDDVLQAKTLFRELSTNGWGWGLAVGVVRHPEIRPGPNQLGNTYAYLPFTASFHDDRAFVHANLGWLRDRATGQHRATWGLGGDVQAAGRLSLIAESYGDNRQRPYWQAGARFGVVPGVLQVDATWGGQWGTRVGDRTGRWFSIGLRFTPERLY